MNNFNNATHITCANGLARLMNPFPETIEQKVNQPKDYIVNLWESVSNPDFVSFENLIYDQPELHCSPELSGTYPVDEFGEPYWRILEHSGRNANYVKCSKERAESSPGFLPQLFIEYIGPKKQERESEKRFIIPEQGMPKPPTTFEGRYGFPMSDINFESPMRFVWTLGAKSGMSGHEKITLLEVLQMYLEGVESNKPATPELPTDENLLNELIKNAPVCRDTCNCDEPCQIEYNRLRATPEQKGVEQGEYLKWVKTEDELPESEVVVLVFACPLNDIPEIGSRRLAYWFEGDWYTGINRIKGSTVTHWMKLPEPPTI